MWSASSAFTDGWLEIDLYFSNGTLYAFWGSSGVWIANNAVLEIQEPRDYYLEIMTYLTDYYVSVWDYY